MKDTINIKKLPTSEVHYTITRTMEETVNRSELEERKRNLEFQIEALEDQVDTLKANLKTLDQALTTGKGRSSKEIKNEKSIGAGSGEAK